MKIQNLYFLVLALISLSILSETSVAQNTSTPKVPEKANPAATAVPSPTPVEMIRTKPPEKLERTTPFDGDLDFPEVDGWDLGPKQNYPQKELGYSVNYESPSGGRVTVYVYDGGVSQIPNELTGPVAGQMRQAKNDIRSAIEAGWYESAKEVRSETITLGGEGGRVKALYVLYDLEANGNRLASEIYVFPYQNYFIKFRATRRHSDDKTAKNPAIEVLMNELDAFFSTPR